MKTKIKVVDDWRSLLFCGNGSLFVCLVFFYMAIFFIFSSSCASLNSEFEDSNFYNKASYLSV